MNSFATDPFFWWSLLVIDWIYFIYKQRPIQVVCFFFYEFWQLYFHEIGPYHVGYLICDHRAVHSIINYYFNVYGEVFISTSLLKDSFAEYRILGWYFLFSVNFISWNSLLACLFQIQEEFYMTWTQVTSSEEQEEIYFKRVTQGHII